jgi:hypothetical protein
MKRQIYCKVNDAVIVKRIMPRHGLSEASNTGMVRQNAVNSLAMPISTARKSLTSIRYGT